MTRESIANLFRGSRRSGTHSAAPRDTVEGHVTRKKLIVVGNPNVGKSVLFNRLTGAYVVVSNYPGTTVEVSRGQMKIGANVYEVVDTPGMYALRPISDEERVGRELLIHEPADVVLHVIDAKNLDRMLTFTLQLIEAGLPVILATNMMDEAEKLGVGLDTQKLEQELGIPVAPTVALSGRGVAELKERINEYVNGRSYH